MGRLLFIYLFLLGSGLAEEAVFVGHPNVRTTSFEGGNQTDKLTREQSIDALCQVQLKGDKYYWASRENKELRRSDSGLFILFSAADGSGYIKIVNGEQAKKLQLEGEAYMEHVHLQLGTLTYWGVTRGLKLK